MTKSSHSRKPIDGYARRAVAGDKVYIMHHDHEADDGTSYPAGTEYVPLSGGADNTRKGAPIRQIVAIGGKNVTFTAA